LAPGDRARIFCKPVNNSSATIEVTLHLSNSSLASQTVGPPGSDVENPPPAVHRRRWARDAHAPPLALQRVAADDSVLGSFGALPNNGLTSDYVTMVRLLSPNWWNFKRGGGREQQRAASGRATKY
jgi:hypothetical protein